MSKLHDFVLREHQVRIGSASPSGDKHEGAFHWNLLLSARCPTAISAKRIPSSAPPWRAPPLRPRTPAKRFMTLLSSLAPALRAAASPSSLDGFDKRQARADVLSGLTVALALVPEAVAFAFVCGVPPLVGLYAAFFLALVTSLFGGRPGMISGATGAVAVVVASLVHKHGGRLSSVRWEVAQ